MQFIAALSSCLFLYCRICVVITVSSALANYKSISNARVGAEKVIRSA